jgi:pyruvate-ferredoxin/flavodoxin oxidoreductase
MVAMDGFLTSHLIEPVLVPERELVAEFLGRPDDLIDADTGAGNASTGRSAAACRRSGTSIRRWCPARSQNQDAYMQATAAQRPYFFDTCRGADGSACMAEYGELTGRKYSGSKPIAEDADYVILGMGSMSCRPRPSPTTCATTAS